VQILIKIVQNLIHFNIVIIFQAALYSFYILGSVHHKSNRIIVQQDAAVFGLLHFCKQLYMFRLLTHIIRSWYNCNYSFCHWSTGSATIRASARADGSRPGLPVPEAVITVVRSPDDVCQDPKYVELPTET